MQIIEKSHHRHEEEYQLLFEWRDMPGAGFSFPCDKEGKLLMDKIPSTARQNLADCLSGAIDVKSCGVRDYSRTRFIPSKGQCECGQILQFWNSWANTCECGREYNACGQLLAPRSRWGEEWVTQPEEDYGLY